MKIDDQLLKLGFVRRDSGQQVLNYAFDMGNGLSLVCYAEAGGLPHDNFPVWFGVSFTRDFVEVCGRSYESGKQLADWLGQAKAGGRFERAWM